MNEVSPIQQELLEELPKRLHSRLNHIQELLDDPSHHIINTLWDVRRDFRIYYDEFDGQLLALLTDLEKDRLKAIDQRFPTKVS